MMSYVDWENESGGNVSGYTKETGRGSVGYSLKGGSSTDYMVSKKYINENKFTIVYSYKGGVSLFWMADSNTLPNNGWKYKQGNLKYISGGITYFEENGINELTDKYGWNTVKIVYEYDDDYNNFISISYLNSDDIWVETYNMCYHSAMPTTYSRRIAFGIDLNAHLDDITIGVML